MTEVVFFDGAKTPRSKVLSATKRDVDTDAYPVPASPITLNQRDISDSDVIQTGTVWALASTGVPSSTLTETLLDGSTTLLPEDPVLTYTVDSPKISTTTELIEVSSGGSTYFQTISGSTGTVLYISSGKTEIEQITQTPTTNEYEVGTIIKTYTLRTTVETYPVTWTSIGEDTTKVESQDVITRTAYIDRRGLTPLSKFDGAERPTLKNRHHLNTFTESKMNLGIIVVMVLASLLVVVTARGVANRWLSHRHL